MGWSTTLRVLSAALLVTPAAFVAAGSAGAATAAPPPVVLAKQVAPGLTGATQLRPTDGTKVLQVAVSIAHPHDADELATFNAMYTPGNALFHHFLTPTQFNARFGVDTTTAGRIEHDVTSKGLTVEYANPDRSYLTLHGTVAQIEKTFAVDLADFTGADGNVFRANVQGPTVPAGVNAVLGLSSLSTFKTHQDICVRGQCTGSMTPQDLWSIYDQPDTNRGLGQKVGIFGEGDIEQPVKDLRQFELAQTGNGIARGPLPQVPVRRIPVANPQDAADVDKTGLGEWDLDEDAITGMAPDLAELSYYFGKDLSDASIGGTYSAWANDPDGPLTGNSSFGGCESLNVALGGAAALDPLLRQATMEGRTMFVSTGDVGGSCGVGPAGVNGVSNGGAPAVEYPSSSPYVVAVGGTVLYSATTTPTGSTQAQPAARSQEIAWTHTGGGTSMFEPKPIWQQGISTIAGVCAADASGNPTTTPTPCRGVPDVASLSGDVVTNGYAIVSNGVYTASGGTSLSSPLWAGMWARVLAGHPSTCTAYGSNGALGFAGPILYSLGKNAVRDAADFYDISVGSNVQWTAIPRNPADPSGWDYVSGLGTPDVKGIMTDADCGRLTPVVAANPQIALDRTVAPATGTCLQGPVSDPAGDAQVNAFPTNTAPSGDPAVDITVLDVQSSATVLTFTSKVVDLSAPATPEEEIQMEWLFSYGGTHYFVLADNNAPAGPPSFTLSDFDANGLSQMLAPLTGSYDTATSTISAVLPYATFNGVATSKIVDGSALTSVSVESFYGPQGAAEADVASYGACPVIVSMTSAATPAVPEVPARPLVLVTGALTVFGAVVLRRRRARA